MSEPPKIFELEDDDDDRDVKRPKPPPAELFEEPKPEPAPEDDAPPAVKDESGIDTRTVAERRGEEKPRGTEVIGPPPEWPREAFTYPIRGQGVYVLIVGALSLVLLDLFGIAEAARFVAWIGKLLTLFVILRGQLRLIATSATGADEPRGVESVLSMSNEDLKRAGVFIALFAASVVPGAVMIGFKVIEPGFAVLALGSMYASVIALGSALADPRLKWPWHALGWIFRNPMSCLAGSLGWWVLGLSEYAINEAYGSAFAIVLFQSVVLRVVDVYVLMCSARAIGVMGRRWHTP